MPTSSAGAAQNFGESSGKPMKAHWVTRSRAALVFWFFVGCSFCSWSFSSVQESQAVEIAVVGEAERPWSEGGGDANTSPPALTPQFRLTPRTAGSGNIPGGVVDFASEPGWIVPIQIDSARNIFDLIREQGGTPVITAPNVRDVSSAELQTALGGIIDGSEKIYARKSTPANRDINPLGEHIDIDLGAQFGIERIRFYPSPFNPDDFLKAYEISVNDGSAASLTESGNPLWTVVFRDDQNVRSDTDIRIPLQFVRYLRLTSRTTVGFEIDEIELYGRGYVPSSRYLSDVFDLGEAQALWGRVRWSDEAIGDPTKSRIFVRTRSGRTPAPLVFTRTVVSTGLIREPFLLAMERVSYDRADIDLVLAPVELPEQAIAPPEYELLAGEVREWLAAAGATYAVLDDSGNEQEAARTAYEAAEPEQRAAVRSPAIQVPPNDYKLLSRPIKGWLQERGARYFRRANVGESVLYDLRGNPLNEASYNRLPEGERGPLLDDTENWSSWSAPYPAEKTLAGIQITSPSPRRYFQFEIRFESEELEAARRVDFLSFEFSSPPVAQQFVAEVFPRVVEPGQSVEFTYAVRSFLDSARHRGFDSFEIQTPVPIQRLLEIQILDPEGRVEAEQSFGEAVEDLALPFQKGNFTLVSVENGRFRVRFPRITKNAYVLKLRFVAAVLRFGTAFAGWALEGGSEELPQPVVAGNVDQLGAGDADNRSGLTVLIDLRGGLLGAISALPNPFTPNGDGINDRAEIHYDVLSITEATPVEVSLYDLEGRRIRTLFAGDVLSGRYTVPWDGTDESGQKVPPGLYLFRIKIRADIKREEVSGAIAAVY